MPEIEDGIFERAACMFPGYAPTLSVVSKRVQTRVEYIMYRTLAVESVQERYLRGEPGRAAAERIAPTLQARPVEFFATRVLNVCITTTVPDEIVKQILAKCTGIQHLALWRQQMDPDDALVLPLSSTLRTLFTNRQVLSWMADSNVVFPHVTYLSLPYPGRIPVPTLEWLPALTTVQLDLEKAPLVDNRWVEDVKTVLSTASQLRSLLLNAHRACLDIATRQVEEMNDPRIEVRDDEVYQNGIVDWKESWRA